MKRLKWTKCKRRQHILDLFNSTPQIEVSRKPRTEFIEWHYSSYGAREGEEKGVLFNDTSITMIL